MEDCILELRFRRPFAGEDTVVAINLGAEYRLVPSRDEVMAGPIPLVSFDTVVEILKRREIGGEIIRKAAERLGGLMAERLEDETGWHGEDRQRSTKDLRE